MRKQIVAGNWKMNLTIDEAIELLEQISSLMEGFVLPRGREVIICPPMPYIDITYQMSDESYFHPGAQDVSLYQNGAYTGDVSAEMLASCGAQYCIVGHSERRAYHAESNQMVAAKIDRLLACDISPIVCVGEVLKAREENAHFDVVAKQVREGLFHLNTEQIGKVIIAYEPIWAIGTGKTATAEQAQEMHAHIRSLIAEEYGAAVADEMSILYGGSCKPSNAHELFACPDVDGGLIGGASLKAQDFIDIVKAF